MKPREAFWYKDFGFCMPEPTQMRCQILLLEMYPPVMQWDMSLSASFGLFVCPASGNG